MRVLIAGGGAAGAAAACLLGPDCTLFERERGPHDKICGEFLSAEALAYLRRLGLDPVALGAETVHAVRLVHGAAVAEARLPFPAMSLSRRVLDAALLERAQALGAEVVRGETVRRLADGVAEVSGAGRMPGHAVFLATGKHDLHGARRRLRRKPADRVGLKMHLRLSPEARAGLTGMVEVVLFPGGYAGLQPLADGAANLCLLLERRQVAAAGGSWGGVQALLETLAPHLRARLAGAVPLLPRPLSIARVPYGFLHRPSLADPANVFRLGDQAGVIPSFSGDGVAMALHSAFSAVAARRAGEGAAAYHHRLRSDLGRQVGRAVLLERAGRLAPALLTGTAALWPGAMRWVARLTRVPEQALLRSG